MGYHGDAHQSLLPEADPIYACGSGVSTSLPRRPRPAVAISQDASQGEPRQFAVYVARQSENAEKQQFALASLHKAGTSLIAVTPPCLRQQWQREVRDLMLQLYSFSAAWRC